MPYMVSIGHNTSEDMELVSPQGATLPGIKTARRVYYPYGGYPDGEQIHPLVYNVLTEEEKNNLDAQFGVSESVLFNECTVQILKNDDTWGNFNVNVEYPEIGVSARRVYGHGWEDVTYNMHLIEELE